MIYFPETEKSCTDKFKRSINEFSSSCRYTFLRNTNVKERKRELLEYIRAVFVEEVAVASVGRYPHDSNDGSCLGHRASFFPHPAGGRRPTGCVVRVRIVFGLLTTAGGWAAASGYQTPLPSVFIVVVVSLRIVSLFFSNRRRSLGLSVLARRPVCDGEGVSRWTGSTLISTVKKT